MRTGLRSPLRTGVRTGGKLAKSLLSPCQCRLLARQFADIFTDVKGVQVRCSMWPLARTRREPRSPRRWGGGDYLERQADD